MSSRRDRLSKWQTRLVQPRSSSPPGFRSLAVPTYRASTTVFPDVESLRDSWDRDEIPYAYGLYGTPTTLELAAALAELEGGTRTLVTPGGQAALSLVYTALLRRGSHVLVPESIYGPSRDFADIVLNRFGVAVSYYPPTIGAGIEALFKPNTCLVWCESPGSITMEVQDVPAIAEVAHAHSAVVALDNTWSAGVYFSAFDHGVDVSIQALTKYVGGHSDLFLGSVTTVDRSLYRQLGEVQYLLGYGASPDDCSLALRGLQTLAVRLEAAQTSAMTIAEWLSQRPEVEAVLHPALASCPGHEIWQRDFIGASGLFSFVFAPRFTKADVTNFVNLLTLFRIGYSWGGVTSLAIPGRNETTRPDYQYGDRLVRLSIGLESTSDLISDLERALVTCRASRRHVSRLRKHTNTIV
jgi:cystathionine beta-lyase